MSRLAYLSTGWESHSGDAPREYGPWEGVRAEVESQLTRAGFEVYRTGWAFAEGDTPSAVRVEVNAAVADRAGAGVVFLRAGRPDLEAPLSVERLLRRGRPVLVVTDLEQSAQIEEWIKRGAQVCRPTETEPWVKALIEQAEASSPTPLADSFRSIAEQLQAFANPVRPLVFEPAEGDVPGVSLEAVLPTRGYSDDAGVDLYVVGDRVIPPGEFRDIPCGVKVDIPAGHWGMITGRSSTLRKRGLLVNPGVIDAGWTGELFAGVQNLGEKDATVLAGERLAQLILLPAPLVGLTPQWGRVPDKERGTRGFGSTGS